MPLKDTGKPFAVANTEFEERDAQFSPDGKWVAYDSDESGRFEVYAQPFSGPGAMAPISTAGGSQVRWSRDGKEKLQRELLEAFPGKATSDSSTWSRRTGSAF